MVDERVDLRADSLQTPCLVVDRSKVGANIERLKRRLAVADVGLRPHLKTAKSYDAALLVMDTPRGPAAVSTLREAEELGANGVTDLLYAVSIAPQKLERITAIRRQGVDLRIVVDNPDAARAAAAHAKATGDSLPVLIEIDVDGHRAGIPLDRHEKLIEVGRVLSDGAELLGVMTHAGESYRASTAGELTSAAEQERSGSVTAAGVLRQAGFECPVVSIGSTPTAFSAENLEGVTELRAGVFMFFDLFQAGVGVCSIDDIALSVVATVIGHQEHKSWTITDAGWTALSADRSTATQAVDQYFGIVCDLDGRPYDDFVVLKANQEHGVLAPRPGTASKAPRLPVGSRVRILPNHACATATQHTEYQIVDGASAIMDVWPRFNGW